MIARGIMEFGQRFEADVQKWFYSKDFESLINYPKHPEAKISVPTPEHFHPLIVVAGACEASDKAEQVTKGLVSLAYC